MTEFRRVLFRSQRCPRPHRESSLLLPFLILILLSIGDNAYFYSGGWSLFDIWIFDIWFVITDNIFLFPFIYVYILPSFSIDVYILPSFSIDVYILSFPLSLCTFIYVFSSFLCSFFILFSC